jgi:uncharacterized protein YmfQ (DUF2313 family)
MGNLSTASESVHPAELLRKVEADGLAVVAQGGAEHVKADQPDQARQLIADWFAQRLSQKTT